MKKQCALLLALLLLWGTLSPCRGEEGPLRVPVPAFSREDAPAARPIQSLQEARQRAQALFACPALGWDVSDAEWSQTELRAEPGGLLYVIAARLPNRQEATVEFYPDGRIYHLYLSPAGALTEYYGSGPDHPNPPDEAYLNAVTEYLLAFAEAAEPGIGDKIQGLVYWGEIIRDDQTRYLLFDSETFSFERTLVVQVAPEFRVLQYSCTVG